MENSKRYITGVGSRQTPDIVIELMRLVAAAFERRGYILRSGGADGADAAFESGISTPSNKEIWLPWPNFNNNDSPLLPSQEAFDMAQTIHPAWNSLTRGGRALHARNCHQVLGHDLKTPSRYLFCWTEHGEIKGGTATAIKLALNRTIPIFNFGRWDNPESMIDALDDFLILNGEYNGI